MSKEEMAVKAQEILTIANEAAAEAREKNRRAGLASPFSMNGKTWYELPDGTITDQEPADSVAA